MMRNRRIRSLSSACLSVAVHTCGLVVLHLLLIPHGMITSDAIVVVPTVVSEEAVSDSFAIELPQLETPKQQDHVFSDRESLTVPGLEIDNPFSVSAGESNDDGHGTIEFGTGFGSKLVRPFGIDVRVGRLLFLVDGSRSMEIDGRRRIAFDEVLTAVRRLSLRQHFGVVLFGDENAPPVFRNELAVPLPEAYTELSRWLHSRAYTDSTFLAEAARLALGLEPDVIILVTDGKYCDARDVHNVWRTAPKELIIHTVNIGTQDGAALLRSTAESHHGEYRFVEITHPADVAVAFVKH